MRRRAGVLLRVPAGLRPELRVPARRNGEPFAVAELESETDEPEGDLVVEWTPIPNRRIWARLYARRAALPALGRRPRDVRCRSGGSERRAAERSGGPGPARGTALGRADAALLPRPRRRAASCRRGRRRRGGGPARRTRVLREDDPRRGVRCRRLPRPRRGRLLHPLRAGAARRARAGAPARASRRRR